MFTRGLIFLFLGILSRSALAISCGPAIRHATADAFPDPAIEAKYRDARAAYSRGEATYTEVKNARAEWIAELKKYGLHEDAEPAPPEVAAKAPRKPRKQPPTPAPILTEAEAFPPERVALWEEIRNMDDSKLISLANSEDAATRLHVAALKKVVEDLKEFRLAEYQRLEAIAKATPAEPAEPAEEKTRRTEAAQLAEAKFYEVQRILQFKVERHIDNVVPPTAGEEQGHPPPGAK